MPTEIGLLALAHDMGLTGAIAALLLASPDSEGVLTGGFFASNGEPAFCHARVSALPAFGLGEPFLLLPLDLTDGPGEPTPARDEPAPFCASSAMFGSLFC